MARTQSFYLLALSLLILQVTGLVCSACDHHQTLCRSHHHGSSCCTQNERCIVGKCFPKRPPPKNPCLVPSAVVCHTASGLLCCAPGQTCGDNQCVSPQEPDTCDTGTTLCNNIDGADCCTAAERCSNGICVDNTFCASDAVVCHTATGLLCCSPEQTCGDNQCVDKVSRPDTCEVGTTACVNIDGTACCNADQLCSAGLCISKTP